MRFVQRLSGVAFLVLLLVSCGSPRAPESNLAGHPSTRELNTMAAEARTKADHQALAQHFQQQADELRAKRQEYEDLCPMYLHGPLKFDPSAYQRCQQVADSYAQAAERVGELALIHEEISKAIPDP